MSGFKLQGFAGIVHRKSAYLLQDNEAQTASNTKLHSGEIRSWRKPGSLSPKAIPPFEEALSIYRMNNVSGDSLWLSWATDVDVVPGPVYDSGAPIYYTGDGTPKKTNAVMAASLTNPITPAHYLEMGVPTPTNVLTVSASGGTTGSGTTPENRVYLFTFISQFGNIAEESAPSPTSAQVSVNPLGTVAIGNLPAAAPAGLYNITKVRIYRSVTGTSSTVFLKVADVAIGTTTFTDNLSATALGVTLPSTTWGPPPSDLKGLVGMANGIMAGFVGNEIFFSEPFMPHAWPAAYGLSVEFEIVGLAAYGSSLVVATKGNPFIISGSTPAAMSQEKLPLYEPCMSKRSISSDEQGAMYASPNGVIKIGPGVTDNITRNLFTRDEWSVYAPSTMVGEVHDGRYYLFYKLGDGGGGLVLDRNEAASPLTTVDLLPTALHTDPVNARLFLAIDGEIKGWDSDPVNNLSYEWRSKIFVVNKPVNFGAAQLNGDFASEVAGNQLAALLASIKAKNQQIWDAAAGLFGTLGSQNTNEFTVNGSLMTDLPSVVDTRYALLTVYGDGVVRARIEVKDNQPFRLPSGYKCDQWEFVINGNVSIRFLKIAETSREMAQI